METKRILTLFLLFAVISIEVLPAQGANIYTEIANQLFSLFKSGDFQFLGHKCEYRRRPKIRKFKLKWEGKVWCHGFAPFSGKALKSSRSGSISGAIRDYAKKVVKSGLATEKEVRKWL